MSSLCPVLSESLDNSLLLPPTLLDSDTVVGMGMDEMDGSEEGKSVCGSLCDEVGGRSLSRVSNDP